MLRLRKGQSNKIILKCFYDRDTDDAYEPSEYKLVKMAIKENHYIEAHYIEIEGEEKNEKIIISSRIVAVNKKRFKTQYMAVVY